MSPTPWDPQYSDEGTFHNAVIFAGTMPPPSTRYFDDGKFYAELIFSAKAFRASLPHSIEAVRTSDAQLHVTSRRCAHASAHVAVMLTRTVT